MQSLNRASIPAEPAKHPPAIHALWVDPDAKFNKRTKDLLHAAGCSVHTASELFDVIRSALETDPQIALISGSLSPHQLRGVAEYVRRQWPRAVILVMGRAAPILDDQLYDATLSDQSTVAEFQALLERSSFSRRA